MSIQYTKLALWFYGRPSKHAAQIPPQAAVADPSVKTPPTTQKGAAAAHAPAQKNPVRNQPFRFSVVSMSTWGHSLVSMSTKEFLLFSRAEQVWAKPLQGELGLSRNSPIAPNTQVLLEFRKHGCNISCVAVSQFSFSSFWTFWHSKTPSAFVRYSIFRSIVAQFSLVGAPEFGKAELMCAMAKKIKKRFIILNVWMKWRQS